MKKYDPLPCLLTRDSKILDLDAWHAELWPFHSTHSKHALLEFVMSRGSNKFVMNVVDV